MHRRFHKVADGGAASLLAFDKPATWSQKYNLVWDRILDLHIFPPVVAAKEIAFYKSKMNAYGVPLDSRTKLGDADHSFFSATLAANPSDFQAITNPFYDYLNTTTFRLPMVDTYDTDNVRNDGVRMYARSVVGGVFVVETSQKTAQPWRWTTDEPADSVAWTKPDFDDRGWHEGSGGFGSTGTPAVVIGTQWKTDDLWIRRTVTLPTTFDPADLQLRVFYDEDPEFYLNGVLTARPGGYVNDYVYLDIPPVARAQLKPGATVTLAVHCHQTYGGQGVDVGIYSVQEP